MAERCKYEVLGLPPLADEEAIKKAFRKMSLKHHPDKGGDPEKFHELQLASQFLLDPTNKREYDKKLSNISLAAKQQQKRKDDMSAARKRDVDALNRREEDALRKKPKHAMDELRQQARRHRDDMAAKRAQAQADRAAAIGKPVLGDIKQRSIRVKWSNRQASHSDQTLVNAFRAYGEIEAVKMKTNSATLVFVSIAAALAAARAEGHNSALWKEVTLIGHAIPGASPSASPESAATYVGVQVSMDPVSVEEYDQLEASVMAYLVQLTGHRSVADLLS
ncbi:hypothetical protein ACHHYP_07522 [Achlya hypogyna]|uniref:J domain-containing protein n=1 Tax=Achlya hypogyna TaxID=1202772 RepID=A0A1V9YQV4_ACHHY|nr:hypothetical protein ACHHYP_07522 [Achlya hypogyna]